MELRRDFKYSQNQEELIGVPSFTTTPYGVRAHIPIIDLPYLSIAVLFCRYNNVPVGLALSRCPSGADPHRPLYHCNHEAFRHVSLSIAEEQSLRPEWKTVYIIAQPPFRADTFVGPSQRPLIRTPLYTNTTRSTPFRVPAAALEAPGLRCVAAIPTKLFMGWAGDPPLTLVYEYQDRQSSKRERYNTVTFSITLGVCPDRTA